MKSKRLTVIKEHSSHSEWRINREEAQKVKLNTKKKRQKKNEEKIRRKENRK